MSPISILALVFAVGVVAGFILGVGCKAAIDDWWAMKEDE